MRGSRSSNAATRGTGEKPRSQRNSGQQLGGGMWWVGWFGEFFVVLLWGDLCLFWGSKQHLVVCCVTLRVKAENKRWN